MDSTNGAIEGRQESITPASGALEDDQTLAGRDQTLADADQTRSDSDQTAADSDQAAADSDQAASDRDLEHGGDAGVHHFTRGVRDRSAQQRRQTAPGRVEAAAARDAVAHARDLAALARDRAAALRDRELAARDAAWADDGRAATGARILGRAAENFRHAAADRAAAAEVRARAAADREQAARDREQAARDRLQAQADRAALLYQLAIAETEAVTGTRTQLELQSQNEMLEGEVRYGIRELGHSRLEAFQKLALAAEYRDDETRQHTQRVGRLASALAVELGFDPAMVDAIGQVAPLHDLGKIGIPDAILLKPGRLTEEESTAMKEHARIGADILSGSSSPLFQVAADIALTHHERWDGTGYPFGLAGETIPLLGRIVSLADAFDAMSHARPYRAAMALTEVLAEIDRCTGTHFDPAVVHAFGHLDPQALLEPPVLPAQARLTGSAWAALTELGLTTADGCAAARDAVLRAAFKSSPTATLIVDDNRRYVAANTAACELLGVSMEELRQKRIDDFVPTEALADLDDTWANFLHAGARSAEFTLLLPDAGRLDITWRGIAHFLPGRHLLLVEPLTGD